jgi:hypothetical protein
MLQSQRNMRKELKKAFEWMAKGERYLKLENIQEIAKEIEVATQARGRSLSSRAPEAAGYIPLFHVALT